MSKDATTDSDEDAPKSKKKLFLIIGVAVLALAGAAYFFLFPGGESAEAAVPGEVLQLEPVAVNLAGGGYLKIGVALQLVVSDAGGSSHNVSGPNGAKATDLIISTFSQAAPADVTGAREALKVALEEKIVEAYHGDVMSIYFTEYVTQ